MCFYCSTQIDTYKGRSECLKPLNKTQFKVLTIFENFHFFGPKN